VNLENSGVARENVSLIKMMSTEDDAIEICKKTPHDVMIIDGDHSLPGVKADFVNYLPCVKRGGYIIFDDYGSPDWPAVQEFVDSDVKNHPDLAFLGVSFRSAVFRVVSKSETAESA
jgi:cephalosporin hydroxylase